MAEAVSWWRLSVCWPPFPWLTAEPSLKRSGQHIFMSAVCSYAAQRHRFICVQRAACPPQTPEAGHLWGKMQLVSKPQLTCVDPFSTMHSLSTPVGPRAFPVWGPDSHARRG